MKKTFSFMIENVDCEIGADGLGAVMNEASIQSGKYISINQVRVYYPSPFNADVTNLYGNQGQISIDRITACSGGTEVSAYKYDPSAGTLPSEIKLVTKPTSITESGGKLRQFGDAFSFTITQAIPWQALLRTPSPMEPTDGYQIEGHNVMHKPIDSAFESIVLPEGYGIACIKRAFGLPQAHHWSVTIRRTDTGKTYRYMDINTHSPWETGQPLWALMNNSGSGLTIQVWIVNFPDLGESNIPRYRLGRISGIGNKLAGYKSYDPIKHDPRANLSGVKGYGGPFSVTLGEEWGCYNQYWDYQTTMMYPLLQMHQGCFRQYLGLTWRDTLTASPVFNFQGFENAVEIWPGDRRGVYNIDDDIIIPPGQGLAVIGSGGSVTPETSEMAMVNVEFTGYQFQGTTSVSKSRIIGGA